MEQVTARHTGFYMLRNMAFHSGGGV